jgi:hypothetical protein
VLIRAALVGGLLALTGRAHDTLAGCLRHHVTISLGARHVDVTVHLTFFEDGSEHEREQMDANRDGQLCRAEAEAYLKQLEPGLTAALKLRAAGKAVDLVPLREPELDLLGHSRTGRWHHRLSLFFFAPTPSDLAAGAELVVEDRLWPGTRAIGLLQVEGRDGARLEAAPLPDALLPPARPGEAREFKARVLTPPKAAATTPADLPRKP